MAKMEWFVQTFDPVNGVYLSDWETWHGYDEDAARAEFARDHKIPQFAERRLISYGVHDETEKYNTSRTVETRIVERFLAGPVTIHGSLARNIRAWAAQGCKVSTILHQAKDTTTNEKADFVALENGMLSYLPAGKTNKLNPDGTWAAEGRQTAKPGKFIRTIIIDEELKELTDSDIEKFANRVKSVNELQAGKLHVVRGSDIAYWYHSSSSGPNGVSSCMAHDSRIKFLRMYCDNPENVGLLIMLDGEGYLKGRALVWTLDDGRTFLDRIYGGDAVRTAFRHHAHEQGWMYADSKAWQDVAYNRDREKPDANTLFCTMQRSFDPKGVYPDTGERIVHPYVDTMRFLDRVSGRLTNDSRMRHTHIMGYAEGGASEVDIRWFPVEGEPEPRKDRWGNYLEDDEPDYTHRCEGCGERFVDPVDGVDAYGQEGNHTRWFCAKCMARSTRTCPTCDKIRTIHCFDRYRDQPRDQCSECFRKGRIDCPNCGELTEENRITLHRITLRGMYGYCPRCMERYFKTCNACHREKAADDFLYNEEDGHYRERLPLCNDCYQRQQHELRMVGDGWRAEMVRWMIDNDVDPYGMIESLRLDRRAIREIVEARAEGA